MTTLSEGKTPGDFLLFEEQDHYSRDEVTIAASADLEPGAVLGKITASGKYVLSVNTETDGSETPVAVLLTQAAAASADVSAVVLARHSRVRRGGLTFDASITTEGHRDTAVAALADVGIIAR